MQTENTQPLYKVLNLARTQGIVKYNDGDSIYIPCKYFDGGIEKDGFKPLFFKSNGYILNENEQESNAKYAVLALNNFSSVCEALELLLDDVEFLQRTEAAKYFNKHILKNINQAKQALNKH